MSLANSNQKRKIFLFDHESNTSEKPGSRLGPMPKTSQKKEIVRFFNNESNNFFFDEIGFTSDMNC
jgi:hypothetical protein